MNYAFILTIALLYRFSAAQQCTLFISQEKFGKETNSRIISCDGISGHEELTKELSKILTASELGSYDHILFKNLEQMQNFPDSTTFRNIFTANLTIENVSLPFWNQPGLDWNQPGMDGNLTGFSGVKSFQLVNVNGLQNWNWTEVEQYTGSSIRYLKIQNSRWDRLPSQIKDIYGDHLKQLVIENSGLWWLDDKSLSCPNCEEISLKNNRIEDVQKGLFYRQKMDTLDLSNNRIKELPKDLFTGFQYNGINEKFTFTLNGNPLLRLYEETFKPLTSPFNKIKIYFDDSKKTFECNCQLKWLMVHTFFDITDVTCTISENYQMKLNRFFIRFKC